MKKQTFTLVLLIISNILFSQTILFNEDFESIPTPTVISSSPILITGGDIPSNWEQLNLDGYNQHTTSSTYYDDFMGSYGFRITNTLNKAAYTRSAPDNIGVSTLTDDYLRTSLINIPSGSNTKTLSFQIQSSGMDSLKVLISNSSSILGASLLFKKYSPVSSSTSFTTYTANLTPYSGQSIYIYFEAYDKVLNTATSNNAGYLMVDNVKIEENATVSGIFDNENLDGLNINIYPNPIINDLYIESIFFCKRSN